MRGVVSQLLPGTGRWQSAGLTEGAILNHTLPEENPLRTVPLPASEEDFPRVTAPLTFPR